MKFKVIDNIGLNKVFDSYKNAYNFAVKIADTYGLTYEKTDNKNVTDKFVKMHYTLLIKLVLI